MLRGFSGSIQKTLCSCQAQHAPPRGPHLPLWVDSALGVCPHTARPGSKALRFDSTVSPLFPAAVGWKLHFRRLDT